MPGHTLHSANDHGVFSTFTPDEDTSLMSDPYAPAARTRRDHVELDTIWTTELQRDASPAHTMNYDLDPKYCVAATP
ncbi:hypothetical protein DXG03_001652 [Asterophora parasitica]|uniref:Uncharacterized protein n=1 Tax=Asterophora parasitica TaxID=117018 RepID=A0A9P7G583_9AGAR|nr:hypothetical protein DXG03_001652 [Asterophora parasitica]